MINPGKFKNFLEEAHKAHFSGWDFSFLNGRMIQEDPPWNYRNLVLEYKKGIHSLLDMGTGGGEFLASLTPLPEETHATEYYPPNQVIALKKLTPLGVKVHNTTEGDLLPFEDGSFDLVINRHDSYSPTEIERILKPSGMFITQQVGGLDNLELNQILQKEVSYPYIEWGLAKALVGLYETNLEIAIAEKAALTSTFLDIGAVVYYLKAIPWQIEGFDPKTYTDGLQKLHTIIEKQGKFTATTHRFLIVANKKV